MRVNLVSDRATRPPSINANPCAPVRLDELNHPYGPCPAALEAMSDLLEAPRAELESRLRKRLCEVYHAPAAAIVLLGSIDQALERIVTCASGPIAGFPPSATASFLADSSLSAEVISVARGLGREGSIDIDAAIDLPPDSVAIVDSPSDPLGSVLAPNTAVRLARASRYLVIDERHAEFAGMSALPLGLEFENIVILRSFASWAGIENPGCAWAVVSPRTVHAIGLEVDAPAPSAIAAAIATLDHLDSVSMTLKLLREERSRLYRFLRKLSFLEPVPSWGPFLAARVQLVPRDSVVAGLRRRGIHVHSPLQPGLEHVVRIGLGSRRAMDRLHHALLDLAPELVA